MKKLITLIFILTILPLASAAQIKHKFVATDESGKQLLYVDETNPENDWTVPLPGNRDIQLSKKGTILVTVPDGYREYVLKDGKLVKEVKAGKGIRSLVRLENGHTILSSFDGVIELDKNDKQVNTYPMKMGRYLRLLRLSKSGNFLYTSSVTAVKEFKPGDGAVRELDLTKLTPECKKPYLLEELGNGQFIVSTGYGGSVLIVDKDWKLLKSYGGKGKVDGIDIYFFSDAQRLKNGNIVVAHWTGHGRKDSGKAPQVIEFDKDGKVVWTWHNPKRAGTLHGIEIIEENKTIIPKVLIIGDSISLGYTPPVAKMLKGEAVVKHSKGGRGVGANAGATDRGIEYLDKFLGDKKWDVIHFNWGLWDLCYRHPDAKSYGNRDKINGKVSIPLVQYEKNLEQLVARLKKTGAKLIWANTTKIPEGEAGRFVGDDVKYNRVAAKIMKKHGVMINDLHALTSSFDKTMLSAPGDVHYKPEGYKKLAQQIAASIRKVLKKGKAK